MIVASTIARKVWGELWGWLAIMLVMPAGLLARHWIATGLPSVVVPKSELEPVDRQAVARGLVQAKGRPAMWILFSLGVAMAALGGAVAFTDGAWYGWLLLLMMSWCAVQLFLMLQRSKPA